MRRGIPKLKKITADGMIDRESVLRIILDNTGTDHDKCVLITRDNIDQFAENIRRVFSTRVIKAIEKRNLEREIQLVSNLLTIQMCIKYNDLLVNDISNDIEEIVHMALLDCYRDMPDEIDFTLDDLYEAVDFEINRVFDSIYKKWKKDDDDEARKTFEKMMGITSK